MMMIDTHCHIDRYPDPMQVAQECEQQRILTVAVTNLPSHFEQGRRHVRQFRYVRLALGLHPLLVGKHSEELTTFLRLLPEVSLIGEVGLDYSREGKGTKEKQLSTFRTILQAVAGSRRFLTIHSRRAESAVLDLLQEFNVGPVVFHWFTGTTTNMEEAIRSGHYFSLNPAMVAAATGRTLIERLPQDRVLTETDGPYLQVGARPATPADVHAVLRHLGSVWGGGEEAAAQRIRENFKEVGGELPAEV